MQSTIEQPDDPLALVKLATGALRRHRHSVVLVALFFSIFGVVAVSLIPDVYRATTTILVDPQKIPERYVSSTVTADPNAHLNMLAQQVLSSSRLQEIVEQADLYPVMRQKRSREEVLDYIRSKIKIELKQGTEQGLSSFSISYEDKDKTIVAPVANQLAASFIDWNLKSRQQQALATTQFLSSELDQAQKSLQEQEAALQAFRMQHAGATPDQLEGNLQALSRLQAEVQSHMDAISRLDEERILLSQVKPVETRDPANLGERGRLTQERNRLEAELQTLKRQFTETYPDVIRAKEQLKNVDARLAALPEPTPDSSDAYDPATKTRLSLIGKDIERHNKQIATLKDQIGAYEGKVQSVPVLETQLAELTRNYETSRQNYQSLLDKRLSAGMSEDLEIKQQSERFTVLDAARTPEKPVKPKRLPMIVGAVFFGVFLAVAMVIGFEVLRGAVSSEAELRRILPPRIPILGTIPPIASQADASRTRLQMVRTVAITMLACAALLTFLLRVKPIL